MSHFGDDSDEQLGTAEINPDDIKIQVEIATGSFGKVYKGELHGSPCAIKQMFQIAGKFDIDAFIREVQIMSKLSHPNVVLLMGASVRPDNIFIITEYIEGTDLSKVLEEKSSLSNFRIYTLAMGIATGMNWLHNLTPPIVHRDLKPANVLIAGFKSMDGNEYWQAKICDFGLSTVRDVDKLTTKNLVGSVAWMPPEALLRQPFDEKVDIYSYSLILWQLFACDKYPMDTSPFRSIQDLTRAVCDDYLRPEIPDHVPDRIKGLLREGWSEVPSERPTFTKIISVLKKAMVPVILNNEKAGKFWNANWSETNVPFSVFYQKMYESWGRNVPESPEEDGCEWDFHCCVHAVFEEFKTGDVSLQNFGKVLNWFGDWDDDFPRKVWFLLKHEWYHGPINRKEAEFALSNCPKIKNAFLVRVNDLPNAPFTVSLLKSRKDKGTKVHQRILRTENGFSYVVMKKENRRHIKETVEEETIYELIEKYLVDKKRSNCVPRLQYNHLFTTPTDEGGMGAYAYEM